MILSDFICWLCWTRACFQHFILFQCHVANLIRVTSYAVLQRRSFGLKWIVRLLFRFTFSKNFFSFKTKTERKQKKMKITLRMQRKRTLYHQLFATHFIFLNLLLLRENANNVNKYKWNNRILNYTQRTYLHFSLELNSTMYHFVRNLNTEWFGIGK